MARRQQWRGKLKHGRERLRGSMEGTGRRIYVIYRGVHTRPENYRWSRDEINWPLEPHFSVTVNFTALRIFTGNGALGVYGRILASATEVSERENKTGSHGAALLSGKEASTQRIGCS